jgi:hypothetical protein
MVNRYERAVGLTLFKFGKYQAEIWFVPSNYKIPEHYHADFDSKLLILFGHNILLHRNKESLMIKWWKHIGRAFAIKAMDIHSFDASKFPLIFINLEVWKQQPTSACKDFVKT